MTESVTQPSVRLSPPFRLLLSSPHSLTTCNFAKLTEKCSVNRVEIFKCCDFQGSKFVGIPSDVRLLPRFVGESGRDTGDESGPGYSVLTAYPLHFTPSQNVSNSRVLLRASRPAQAQHAHHPVTSKHSAISCSLSHRRHCNALKHQTASFVLIKF